MSLAKLFYAKHPRRIETIRRHRPRTRPRRRRFLLEPLESRILLSADSTILAVPAIDPNTSLNQPVLVVSSEAPAAPSTSTPTAITAQNSDPSITDNSQLAAILGGLQGLTNFGATLSALGQLAQPLPIADKTIGQVLDISNILQTKLADPLVGKTITDIPDTTVLRSLLAGVLGAGESITDTSTAGELKFDVVLHSTTMTSTGIDLGSNATATGLGARASAMIGLDTTLDFSFSFGLSLTSGLAPSEAFFIRPVNLAAHADVHGSGLTFGITTGFLEADVMRGSLDLDADVNVALTDPNTDGSITLAELQGTPIDSLVTLTPSGSLSATLPVEVTLGTFTTNPSSADPSDPTIILGPSDPFSGAPSVSVQNFAELLNFTHITPHDVVALLDQLGTAVQGVASGLNVPGGIPFVDQAINQVVNFTDMLADFTKGMFDVVQTGASQYAGATAAPSNGRLTADAVFSLGVGGADPVQVTLDHTVTSANLNVDALVTEINTAIGAAGVSGVTAGHDGSNHITFTAADSFVLRFAADNGGEGPLRLAAEPDNAGLQIHTLPTFVPPLGPLVGGRRPPPP